MVRRLRSSFEWEELPCRPTGRRSILIKSDKVSSATSWLNRGRSEDQDELFGRSNSMSGWSHTKRRIIILLLFDDTGKTAQKPTVAAHYPGLRIHKRIYGGFR